MPRRDCIFSASEIILALVLSASLEGEEGQGLPLLVFRRSGTDTTGNEFVLWANKIPTDFQKWRE